MDSYVIQESAASIELMSTHLLLHVDDDYDEAFLLERALDMHGLNEWTILHRETGEGALKYLDQAQHKQADMPDLIVLDIKMPGIGGMKVLEWASANVPEVPVVILSSSGLLKDRLRARDLGSVGYYEKSPTFADLIDFLRSWEMFRERSQGRTRLRLRR
jgi:DNA-binding response OmpR family regulator